MTYIKLLSLKISNKLNIRIENIRVPGYVMITTIVFTSFLVGVSILDKV